MGIKKFIQEKHGDAALEKYYQAFTPEELRYIGPRIVAISKVPAKLLDKTYQTVIKQWGDNKPEYYSRVMEYVAEYNINIFLKVFIKLGNPAFMLNAAPHIWKQYFSVGKLITTHMGKNSAEFESVGGEAYGEALCRGILGWAKYAVACSGGKNLRLEHTECIYKGDSRCYFKGSWE